MPDAPIRAVVFDFGGVLITPITRHLTNLAVRHGVPMEQLLLVLMGPREESTADHPWHRAERGEIPTADFIHQVQPYAAAQGIQLAGDEYEIILDGVFDLHHGALADIADLRRAGYRTGLLTNSFREFRAHLEQSIDFGLFDVVVDSSEVGCRKPEPQIYAMTAEAMGCRPEEILYLDDFLANVEGALAAGWQAVHVNGEAEVRAAVAPLLGGSTATALP
ncbi:MAG: HAD family phosphatase [Ilumatobacteraceae bacterium]|nr:HAD family phosphatase [Ilumatobacter sp.]